MWYLLSVRCQSNLMPSVSMSPRLTYLSVPTRRPEDEACSYSWNSACSRRSISSAVASKASQPLLSVCTMRSPWMPEDVSQALTALTVSVVGAKNS